MWPNPQVPAGLVTFTEEIFNGKLDFLCSVNGKDRTLSMSEEGGGAECFSMDQNILGLFWWVMKYIFKTIDWPKTIFFNFFLILFFT